MAHSRVTLWKKQLQQYVLIIICAIPFVFVGVNAIQYSLSAQHQQFSILADSFLHGQLSFPYAYDRGFDTVFFQGKYFWPLGPFPAIFLLPFVWLAHLFNLPFFEAFLHFFLFLAIWYIWYRIAKQLHYSARDALYWAYAFCFSSALFGEGIVATSWHFAHLMTVLLLSLALYEYVNKKRFFVLGLLLGLTAATRISAGVGLIFFILTVFNDKKPRRELSKIGILLAPYISIIGLVFLYNFARFGNFLESGYSLQTLFFPELQKARSYGVFNLTHIPGNLYYFLLNTPKPVLRDGVSQVLQFPYMIPDYWGLGLWVVSPYYIYLLILSYRDYLAKILWVTVFCIALPIFCYYGIGYNQYGYRYALDFLPFLFFLLIKKYRQQYGQLSLRLRILIILGCIWNAYLLVSLSQL